MAEVRSQNSFGPKDRQRVDVDQQWECVGWSKAFGVSVDELRAAVKEVGPLVAYLDRIAYLDRYLLSCRIRT
jgi:uncharacterized protein DUF3606